MNIHDKQLIQVMIAKTMTKPNIRSLTLSMVLGFSLLGFYAHGLLKVVGIFWQKFPLPIRLPHDPGLPP